MTFKPLDPVAKMTVFGLVTDENVCETFASAGNE